MKIVDLSHPITKDHYRWEVTTKLKHNFEPGQHPQMNTLITKLGMHYFTHCDSEIHFFKDIKRYVGQVPLEQWIGPACVVNLTHLGEDGAVSAAELEKHGQKVKPGDIVILRTDWPLKCSIDSKDFWAKSPYTTDDACEWLINRGAKTVCYDYSPDYCIRYEVLEPGHVNTVEDFTTHNHFFPKNILVIEYLANLHKLSKDRFFFIGLPLYIQETEGAPCRCIAIEDIDVD